MSFMRKQESSQSVFLSVQTIQQIKKLAFFFIFVLSSFLKKKQFPIILSSLQQPHGADLLSLDQMEQENFMLIHIRRHNNKCKETQVAVYEVIITIIFTISKACYMYNKPVFCILYGSI